MLNMWIFQFVSLLIDALKFWLEEICSVHDNNQADFVDPECAQCDFNSLASILSIWDLPQISSLIPQGSVPSAPMAPLGHAKHNPCFLL